MEIGFVPPGVSRSYYRLNHQRCRTSWAQISSTAAYCTWDKTKRLKINRLVIKIADASDYMCACGGSQSRERPGLLDLLFPDEYLMDCATRRPWGMMGSGGDTDALVAGLMASRLWNTNAAWSRHTRSGSADRRL